MNRSLTLAILPRCLSVLVIYAVFICLNGCRTVTEHHKGKRPNFLVLIADDQRWDQLSCADHPLIPELKTPAMDTLAQQGVYYRHAFVTTSICAVSRACIMTGRYASTHGMNHFKTSMTKDVLSKSYPALLHDNGYLWGEHGLGGKWLLYEESIRVPIIIRGPGLSDTLRGTKLDDLALNIDVAPTILDMAGIPIPSEMDVKSLYPRVSARSASSRANFFLEHVGVIDVETPIPDSRGVRSKEWKYIRYVNVTPEVEELYHLKVDPLESHNLADDPNYSDIKKQLQHRYDDYFRTLANDAG